MGKGFWRVVSVVALAGAAQQANAQSADFKGSLARLEQPIFNNSVRDSYYFERNFPPGLAAAKGDYANALRFATCAVAQDVGGARAIAALDAGSAAETNALSGYAQRQKRCITSRVSLSPALLRGAIAEALWKTDGALANPGKLASIDMKDIESFFAATPHGDTATKIGALPMAWVARCQAMAAPNASAGLLATTPGTPEERSAAATLYSKSGVCGTTTSGSVGIDVARANVADALYQNAWRFRSGR